MTDRRLHVGTELAGGEAHVIVTWPAGAAIADVEELIKRAARTAITSARERIPT